MQSRTLHPNDYLSEIAMNRKEPNPSINCTATDKMGNLFKSNRHLAPSSPRAARHEKRSRDKVQRRDGDRLVHHNQRREFIMLLLIIQIDRLC